MLRNQGCGLIEHEFLLYFFSSNNEEWNMEWKLLINHCFNDHKYMFNSDLNSETVN